MRKLIYIFLLTGSIAFGQEKTTIQQTSQPTLQTSVTPTVSPTAPVITFQTTTHDFGTVKKGSSITYKFKFKNTGKESLIIYECRAGCHCTTANCSKDPIKPGKTGYVEVRYDSTRVGVINKEVLVSSNASNMHVSLVIKGNVTEGEVEKSPADKSNSGSDTKNK